MDTDNHTGGSPSFSFQLAQLLARAGQQNILVRLGAIVAFLWLWLTLLRFTLGVSDEPFRIGAGSLRGAPDLGVGLFLTVISLVAAFPVLLVWNQLLRLTGTLPQLITKTLYWDSKGEDADQEVQINALKELVQNLIKIFVSWFRFFAISWIIIIVLEVVENIVVLGSLLAQGGLP